MKDVKEYFVFMVGEKYVFEMTEGGAFGTCRTKIKLCCSINLALKVTNTEYFNSKKYSSYYINDEIEIGRILENCKPVKIRESVTYEVIL